MPNEWKKQIIDSVPEGPATDTIAAIRSKSLWTWLVGMETVAIIILTTMLLNRPTNAERNDAAVIYRGHYERLVLERDYFQRAVDSCEVYRLREANDCNNRILDLLDFTGGRNKITITQKK